MKSFFAPGIHLRVLPYLCFLMTLIQFGVEGSLVGSIQASDQWQTFFDHPTGSSLGILSSISTLGEVAGNLLAPFISDRLGRKGGVLVGASGTLLFVALQASAQNLSWYLAARFFLGVFLLFCHNASPAYLSEFAPTKERSTILGFYSPFYYVGAIVISWTCYSTVNWPSNWSWRAPSLVQAVPALLQLALLSFVPESPRWLALHGQREKAFEVLVKYHGEGVETEEVTATYKEIIDSTDRQLNGDFNGSWRDLFATKSMRIRSVIAMVTGIASQWSGNGLISYYITLILESVGITNGKTQTLFNGMLNVWTLLFCIFVAFLAQRVGRRPIFLVGVGGMLVVWILFTGLSAGYAKTGSAGMGAGVLAMIFLFNTTYGAAWSTMFMYPVELWPSAIRSKALAVQNSIDYIGLFLNVYVNPIAMDAIAWKYYIVYIVLLAFQLVFVYYVFIETKGLSTEQICDYFDGQVGPVKWAAGPTSKKLLLESQAISVARREEMRLAAAGEIEDKAGVDADVKAVDGVHVVPALP